jgi:hypothetical protein
VAFSVLITTIEDSYGKVVNRKVSEELKRMKGKK